MAKWLTHVLINGSNIKFLGGTFTLKNVTSKPNLSFKKPVKYHH